MLPAAARLYYIRRPNSAPIHSSAARLPSFWLPLLRLFLILILLSTLILYLVTLNRAGHPARPAWHRRRLRPAIRTHPAATEHVKSLPASPAHPERPRRRRFMAGRTCQSLVFRRRRQSRQHPRLLQAAPAIQNHQPAHQPQPHRVRLDGKQYQRPHPHQSQRRRDHQAARIPDNKPEQRL